MPISINDSYACGNGLNHTVNSATYKCSEFIPAGEEGSLEALAEEHIEEQNQKMLNFAEKAGWRMQKLEEYVERGLREEMGIKRIARI
ncbi:hypothetical protein D5086_000966 [Populus alba]|uniref:Uncharacterized protein n=1 Tax=Populus alba TaxID=43335 RepID=A0ACC4CXD1_POPAL